MVNLTDELGFPFDSVNGDRGMSAGSWRTMLSGLFTNGIFKTDDFQVTVNGMNAFVSEGNAFVNGAFFPSAEKILTIESASGSYDRYDSIVIEFNSADRKVSLKVVKGGSDSKWITPSRTSSVYQLVIAVINVKKGSTSLSQSNISDVRSDPLYCGYVTSTSSQERFEKQLQELKTQINNLNDLNTWSDWKSCGKNGCNVELRYRYNEAAKLVELNWDGLVNATVAFNTMGYMWNGFPLDKTPKKNVFIPVQTQSNDLTLRFYPVTSDMTANHWTLTAMHANVSTAYVCGTFIYSYA